jgi:hypothetical protein
MEIYLYKNPGQENLSVQEARALLAQLPGGVTIIPVNCAHGTNMQFPSIEVSGDRFEGIDGVLKFIDKKKNEYATIQLQRANRQKQIQSEFIKKFNPRRHRQTRAHA